MPTNYEWLLHMDGDERQAWFDAEHVDDLGQIADMSQKSADCVRNDWKMSETGVSASDVDANDENATQDSREKLEADVRQYANPSGDIGTLGAYWEKKMLEFLDRQVEITAEESAEAWEDYSDSVQREIAELQADNDERWRLYTESCEKIAELEGELAKRDKGIARLKRQRDTARAKIDELHAECDTCCYKTDYIEIDMLEAERDRMQEVIDDYEDSTTELEEAITALEAERDALRAANMALKADSDECVPKAIKKRDEVIKILKTERDALAADLRDCERERERLRQALGCAIDHAHEIVSLVNLDGEVIG